MKIRTADALYSIDNVVVMPYCKNWFSVKYVEVTGRKPYSDGSVSVVKMPNKPTDDELAYYRHFYNEASNMCGGMMYYQFDNHIVPSWNTIFAQPAGYGDLIHIGLDTTTRIMPWRAMPFTKSTTDVAERYRIVERIDDVNLVMTNGTMGVAALNDAVLTHDDLLDLLVEEIDTYRQQYGDDVRDDWRIRNTVYFINGDTGNDVKLLNIVVDSDSLHRVYAGSRSSVSGLREGGYKVTYLWSDSTYSTDSIAIRRGYSLVVPYSHTLAVANSPEMDSLVHDIRLMIERRYVSRYGLNCAYTSGYFNESGAKPNTEIQIRGIGSPRLKSFAGVVTEEEGTIDAVVMNSAMTAESVAVAKTADSSMPSIEELSFDVRGDFSDVGFWCPDLVADENGEVTFEVVYPEDITMWNQMFVAMQGKRRGYTSCNVNASLPIEATLNIPRFAIEGDSCVVNGEVREFVDDTIAVGRRFSVDDIVVKTNDFDIVNGTLVDSCGVRLPLLADGVVTDTMMIEYAVGSVGGAYSDGESRELPVYAQGVELIDGCAMTLRPGDTTVYISSFGYDTPIELALYGDIMPILVEEIERVAKQEATYNDALASRLFALLLRQQIMQMYGEQFRDGNKVRKLLDQLIGNRNSDGLWSWCGKKGSSLLWVSEYIYRVLAKAEAFGYEIKPLKDKSGLAELLVQQFYQAKDKGYYSQQIQLLELLNHIGCRDEVHSLLMEVSRDSLGRNDILYYDLLGQSVGQQIDFAQYDTIRKADLLGGEYFDFGDVYIWRFIPYMTSIRTTLLAHELYRNSSQTDKAEHIAAIEQWLLAQRRGCWRNHYESMLIVDAILEGYKAHNIEYKEDKVIVATNEERIEVAELPFAEKYSLDDTITVAKQGMSYLYLSAVQRHFEKNPVASGEGMTIVSQADSVVACGETFDLVVNVTMDAAADYVVVSVPIPAGSLVAGYQPYTRGESAREELRHKVDIYCNRLEAGTHRFTVRLVARYPGLYTVNPAHASLVYFPSFSANTEVKSIEIR